MYQVVQERQPMWSALGRLTSHPESALVLQNTTSPTAPRCKRPRAPAGELPKPPVTRNLRAAKFSRPTPRCTARWTVFVDLPSIEAYAPSARTIARTPCCCWPRSPCHCLGGMFLAKDVCRSSASCPCARSAAATSATHLHQTRCTSSNPADQFQRHGPQLQISYPISRPVEGRTRELTAIGARASRPADVSQRSIRR